MKIRPSVLVFYLVPIILIAFIAALATASIGSLSGWGFPLQWKIGGCTTINGGLTCAEEFDNLWFFAADVAFFTAVGYGLLSTGFLLTPRLVERVAVLGPRSILFVSLLGSSITLAMGLLAQPGMFVNPGGISSQLYGFPFIWKSALSSCPPPCLQANGTFYNWTGFVGDCLFYAIAGMVALPYWLRKIHPPQRLKIHLHSRKILGVLVLLVVAFAASNYAYDSVYGTGNQWTGYGRLVMDHYSFQNANVVTVWLDDIGPGWVTLTTVSVTNGNGPVATFQLNMTIDQGTLGVISENTTSQGLQLTQGGSYQIQTLTSNNIVATFSVTWT